MKKLRDTALALTATLALCAGPVVPLSAQNEQQSSPSGGSQSAQPIQPIGPEPSGSMPVPAARGVSGPDDSAPYDPSQVTPDQNTLAGAQPFSVGSLEHVRNVFEPSVTFSQLGQTFGGYPTGQGTNGSNTSGITMLSGTVDFDRTWSRYHTTLVYNGGEAFTFGGPYPSGHNQFHELTFTQQGQWGRWHALLRDDFTANPGAAFTGAGMGGPGLIAEFSSMVNSSLNGFGQAFIPAETIATGYAMRYRNALLGQAEYSLTRRSAFTFAAGYGTLNFPSAGYLSSAMFNVQAGYDYEIDPFDSVALLGGYGKITYAGGPSGGSDYTTDYMVALAFGRRVTGRLAFQAAVGPEQVHSIIPAYLGVQSNSAFDKLLPAVNAALTYDLRRTGVSFEYQRGLNAGSGVFIGAISDTFSVAAHYLVTRYWTATFNGGYALNNSIPAGSVPSLRFHYWFIGANAGRRLNQHMDINFNYGLQEQGNPAAICPVTSCGIAGFEQTFGMSVNWRLRPAG